MSCHLFVERAVDSSNRLCFCTCTKICFPFDVIMNASVPVHLFTLSSIHLHSHTQTDPENYIASNK